MPKSRRDYRCKSKEIRVALAALAAAFVLILTACSCAGSRAGQDSSEGQNGSQTETTSPSQAFDGTVEWKGGKYRYNRDLTNILFLGIDRDDEIAVQNLPHNSGQSDCMILLSLDKSTQQGHILQINRNTMTQMDLFDLQGNKVNTTYGQITLQYAYGIGGTSSCFASKQTVSKLLFGLEIDAYFAMNLEALEQINDSLGGVDVLMKEDYTHIDQSFVKGEIVHLTGKLAERFIRYRDTGEFNSVQNRMERQVDYVSSLIAEFKDKSGVNLYDTLSPYLDQDIVTDMSAEQLNALKNYTYLTDEVEYLPGEMKMGEIYEELYVDADALQELIIGLFYTKVE